MIYQLSFYVPVDSVESVKQALFDVGAGKLDQHDTSVNANYDFCSWQTLGIGQFRPLEGSQPAVGNINEVTQVDEYKVEMLCEEKYISTVIQTLKQEHPYEQPAYSVIALANY